MKHLFLVRHAKSSWADETLSDRERPLSARGVSQLAPLGNALKSVGAFEGEVYSSSARRAVATLQGILPDTVAAERYHTLSALYTFDYRRLLAWLEEQADAPQITLVGHNPALLELAQSLLKQPPEQLPTASVIHIRLSIKHWRQIGRGKGKLVALITPKDYSYAHFERKPKKRARTAGDDPASDIPKALHHQLDRLRQLERGVALGLDDEFPHQYRIAIRRSRAIAESMTSWKVWLLCDTSINPKPLPLRLGRDSATSATTSRGSTAGPAPKLWMRPDGPMSIRGHRRSFRPSEEQ